SVKWMLVTAFPKLTPGRANRFGLHLEEKPAASHFDHTVDIAEDATSLRVDNGALRFSIRKDRPAWLAPLEIKDRDRWVRRTKDARLELVLEREGRTLNFGLSKQNYRVNVEERNTLRSVIAISGQLEAKSGETFGPYV